MAPYPGRTAALDVRSARTAPYPGRPPNQVEARPREIEIDIDFELDFDIDIDIDIDSDSPSARGPGERRGPIGALGRSPRHDTQPASARGRAQVPR